MPYLRHLPSTTPGGYPLQGMLPEMPSDAMVRALAEIMLLMLGSVLLKTLLG